VVPEFVIQGGGFTADLEQKDTRDPIVNESTNGLKNVRGSLAMARLNAPNSATAQFYINLVDNTSLDRTETSPGYAVFGRVIVGMDIVDEIAEVETGNEGQLSDVPLEDIVITSADRTSGVEPE
jgi:peptidyl-prolyl cis-trans isomerase A (cyclophilin A)